MEITVTEQLYDLYSSPDIIRVIKSRRMRWAGRVARMGQKRDAYRVSVVKSGRKEKTNWKVHLEERTVLGCRMDLKQIDTEAVGWIELACDRDKWRALVNPGVYLCVP